MKSRRTFFLSGLLVGVLGTFAITFLISKMPCGTRPAPGVREASSLYKWINAWSNDHGGDLPAKLEDLKTVELGVPDDFTPYLDRVIEYRGGGRNFSTLAKDFVILRCRVGRHDELEARIYADGHARAAAPESFTGAYRGSD